MTGNLTTSKLAELSLVVLPMISGLPVVQAEPQKTFAAELQSLEHSGFDMRVDHLEQCANQGQAHCQAQIGNMYRLGLGMEKNEYAAFEMTRKAAEQGYAPAQLSLGLMYLSGEGVTEDEYAGLDWVERAAKNGSQEAKVILTHLLEATPEGC